MSRQERILAAATAVASGASTGAALGAVEAGWLTALFGGGDPLLPAFLVALTSVFGLAAGLAVAPVAAWTAHRGRAVVLGAAAIAGPWALVVVRFHVRQVFEPSSVVQLGAGLAAAALVGAVAAALWVRPPGVGGARLAALLLPTLLGAAGVVAVIGRAGSSISGASEGPTTILLMVDTLRADALGSYGGPVRTPNFDRLARSGVVFERAYATSSWTRPSVTSLLTSTLPSTHGVGFGANRLADEVVTLPEALSAAGVPTAAVFNNINVSAVWNLQQGFDAVVVRGPRYPLGGTMAATRSAIYGSLYARLEALGGTGAPDEYTPAEVILGDVRALIDAAPGAFVYAHLMEPHDPYVEHPARAGTGDAVSGPRGVPPRPPPPPPARAAADLRSLYLDEVRFLDAQLGAFLDELGPERLRDALIVVTADHGEEFQDHGGYWHGPTLYDEMVRVPLIVKLPGDARAGERVTHVVRGTDVAPTIAALRGVQPPEGWLGTDLLTADADRVVVQEAEYDGSLLAGIVRDGFKLVRAEAGNKRGLPPVELYHLTSDPMEQTELSQQSAPVAASLGTALDAELEAARAGKVVGEEGEMDAATRAQLEALGYVE